MSLNPSEPVTADDLKELLLSITSPRPLLRPRFWRMPPSLFVPAFKTQFLNRSGSCDLVYDCSPGTIWLGNKYAAENILGLKKLGITHLLNCTGGTTTGGRECCTIGTGSGSVRPNIDRLSEEGIEYKPLCLRDVEGENITNMFHEAGSWISAAIEGGGQVMVNCFVGSSRSATIVIAYLMAHQRVGLVEAVKDIKQKRDILPNDGFIKQLVEYQQYLVKS